MAIRNFSRWHKGRKQTECIKPPETIKFLANNAGKPYTSPWTGTHVEEPGRRIDPESLEGLAIAMRVLNRL